MNVDVAQLRCVATGIGRHCRLNFMSISWRGMLTVIALAIAGCSAGSGPPPANPIPQLGKIKHIVFIIQENHTFDSIFGGPNGFPGADTVSSGKLSNGTMFALTELSMGNQPGLANGYQDWLKLPPTSAEPESSVS